MKATLDYLGGCMLIVLFLFTLLKLLEKIL